MPYACRECERVFTNYSTFSSHKKRTHKPPKKQCVFCDRVFYTNSELYKHCWVTHRLGAKHPPTDAETACAEPVTAARPCVNALIPAMFR